MFTGVGGFLGWGVCTMSVTSHSRITPCRCPVSVLLMACCSWHGGQTGEAIQLVSNRHGVIESYQYHRLTRALVAGEWSAAHIIGGVSAQPTDTPLSYDAMVHALTAESVEAAASFDASDRSECA